MKNIVVLHGPNLNLLGEREPDVYGNKTLDEINQIIIDFCNDKELSLRYYQANSEGEIIDYLQEQRSWAHGIIINPAAYTHYSYAIRDCISALAIPTVEVHLSNISKREEFRKISVIHPVCIDQIYGFSDLSYIKGIEKLIGL